MGNFQGVFGQMKPVIAMVHLGALPGSPLYDAEAGINGLLTGAAADLEALQAAGVDAIMFGNENDRPYEFDVDRASTATMAYLIGEGTLKSDFGSHRLWMHLEADDGAGQVALETMDCRLYRAGKLGDGELRQVHADPDVEVVRTTLHRDQQLEDFTITVRTLAFSEGMG